MLRFLTILVLQLVLLHVGVSQTVKGRITDPLTGKGISNLTVTIGDLSVVTDSLGNYVLNIYWVYDKIPF